MGFLGFFRVFPFFLWVFSGCKLKFWVGLGSRSIQELRVGSGFSLGLKVWVGLGHKLGKILGLLWVKALVTFRFSGWVGSGFFGFFANSNCYVKDYLILKDDWEFVIP